MNKLILVAIIVFAAFSRLIPHPPNFTPIITMGLFAGAYLKDKRIALLIPLLAMLLADTFLGFYGMIYWVYGSLIIISCIGILLKNRTNLMNCTTAALGSSLIFFLVTNFGFWTSGMYGYTLEGLWECYVLAIPFFGNSFVSTLLFSMLIEAFFYFNKNIFIKIRNFAS